MGMTLLSRYVYLSPSASVAALIACVIVFYYIYRKNKHGDIGCLSIIYLPLLPFTLLFGGIGKLSDKALEYKSYDDQFSDPPSLTLKIMIALSLVAVWILGFILLLDYDESNFWSWIWGIFMPLVSFNLYLFWTKVLFVELSKVKHRTAVAICITFIVLIIIFWVFAIPAFKYYTSMEYMNHYWQVK